MIPSHVWLHDYVYYDIVYDFDFILLTIKLNLTCRKDLQEEDETCSKRQVFWSARLQMHSSRGSCSVPEGVD